MERHALNQTVLGSFYNLKASSFQRIVEVNSGGLAADQRDGLGFLRLILINGLFRNGVSAGEQSLHGQIAVFVCGNGFVEVLTLDRKGNPCNDAVLRSLFQCDCTGRCLHIQICLYCICIFHTGHNILQAGITIGDQFCAAADRWHIASCGGDSYRTVKGCFGCDRQLVAGFGHTHFTVGCGKGIVSKDTIVIRQSHGVFPVLIGKLFCNVIRTTRHKTRNGIVFGQQRNDLVIHLGSTAVWIIGTKVQAVRFLAGLLVSPCGLTASRHKFPDEGLCGKPFLIITSRKMTAVPLIAIEQGKPHCFFLAGRKGIPCLGRIFLEGIACFQRYTRLNTERIIAVYIHTVLVTACSACGITVKHCTGVIAHGISIPVISEVKGNRANVSCSKCCCRWQHREGCDRSHDKGRSLFE